MFSGHLQSEQLVRVYFVFLNGDEGLRRGGKLATTIQPPHSGRVEAPFGFGELSRGWWEDRISRMDAVGWGGCDIVRLCASFVIYCFHLSFESLFSTSRIRPLERPGADSRGAARSVRGHKAQPGEPLWLHPHRWVHRGVWYADS